MPTGESLAIAPATSQAQVNELEREAQRLGLQLQRLAAALADGDDLPSVLAALREKEARRGTIQGQIQALQRGTSSLSLLADFEKVQGDSSTGSTTGAGCCRGGRPGTTDGTHDARRAPHVHARRDAGTLHVYRPRSLR